MVGIVGGPISIFDMQQANELGGDFVSNPVDTGFFLYTILGFVILVTGILSAYYWWKTTKFLGLLLLRSLFLLCRRQHKLL